MIREEERLLIGATLTALPPQWERVLRWKYREGLSVAEIARRLAASPKAAESLLGRARAAFKEMYRQLAKSEDRLHEVEEWTHE
jgi:DNA-directed RNA polymerase specialized sigma24 family protein